MQNVPRGEFCISFGLHKLSFVIKISVLSIFEWSFITGFTVYCNVKLIVLPKIIHL